MATKRTNELVAKLRENGAQVVKRGSRWRVTQPGKGLGFLATTDPTDRNGFDNKIADLRRKGYRV
ncbi:hypothetical protein ABT300_18840 [Streptomyces sp. NPDC001027]|uniref:hypothetical protein n=1 Tax=Streptomyces sp. NPDC001027 TaxID=3154771 RepID=UPI00332D4344